MPETDSTKTPPAPPVASPPPETRPQDRPQDRPDDRSGDRPAGKPDTRPLPPEIGGPTGPEPTRYGDWERKGRVSDF